MKHLFVIQCHEYEQPKKLHDLLKSIDPAFEILMSVDWNYPDVNALFTQDGIKSISLRQSYYSLDAAVSHILRFSYLSTLEFDWMHLISGSDLPFSGIFNIDDICKGKEIICQLDRNPRYSIPHASTWYSLSLKSVKFIQSNFDKFVGESLTNLYQYLNEGCNGGYDEYLCGWLLSKLIDHLNLDTHSDYTSDGNRFIVFPEYLNSGIYGLPDSISSPVTFIASSQLMDIVSCDRYLFGRKFKLNSDAYSDVSNYISKSINK